MKKRLCCLLLAMVLVIGLVPATALTASAAAMSASENAINTIKAFEGFHPNAYQDNGQWSIGYGTSSTEGATITREEADAAMRAHVDMLETAINNFASDNSLTLSQCQFDALISFSYNCGTAWTTQEGKFRSAILNKATGNDFLYAICLWGNVGTTPSTGLIKRRLCEANMYLNNQYSTVVPNNFTYVLLDANGGSVGEDKMQGYDTTKSAPIKVTPTHSNKSLTFAGWFTAKTNGAEVTSLTAANAGKTLYALWGIKVKVTNSYVNVRAGAGTANKALGQLHMGDEIVIFETTKVNNSLWGRFDGGWVALEYTSYDVKEPAQDNSGSESDKTDETVVATATVSCNSYVNVRNNPGTIGTTIVGRLANGTKVDIYQIKVVDNHKWGRVSSGWFCLDYAIMDTTSGSTGAVIRTGFVHHSYVNVRNNPGTMGTTVVGKLNQGDKVNIYDFKEVNNKKWARIGENRWVCMDYVTLDPENGGSTGGDSGSTGGTDSDSGTGSTGTVIRTGYVHHTYVNVRNNPGTVGTTVVGKLYQGDKVNIYDFKEVNSKKWACIGQNRWVCMDYVTLDSQNGGSTGGNTGSGTTEVYGIVVLPAGTNLYDENLNVIAAFPQAVSTKVFGYAMDDGGKLYYVLESGYVEAEGLELTLTEAEYYTASVELTGYETPGDMNSNIATLKKDAKIQVTKVMLIGETLWCYTTDGTISAWVDGEYLVSAEPDQDTGSGDSGSTGSGNTGSDNTGSDSTDGVLHTGYVHHSYVNVRNAPGTVGTTVVGQLNYGAKVSIYDFKTVNNHKWARIGENRWVCMDYITVDVENSGSTGDNTGSTGGNAGSTGGNTGSTEGDTGNTGDASIATGFVTSNTLNIRSGPGMGYASVGTLSKNNRFNVYEYKLNNNMIWGRIGGAKWICLSYTLLDSTGTITGTGEMGTVVRTGYAVNVRSGPSSGYALMGKLMVNSRVEVFEQKNVNGTYWGRISLGWICMDYVMLDSELPPGLDLGFGAGSGSGTGSDAGSGSGSDTGAGTGSGSGSDTGAGTGSDTGTGTGSDTGTGTGGTGSAMYTGKVILTNSLKIRQTPSTSGTEVGTLQRNAGVTIYEVTISEYMAWGRCDKGWICLTYVDLVPASGNGAVDARVVQYEGLNIREGAGTTYKSVGTYSKGQVVDIFQFSGNWGKTAEGWVCLDYLLT